MRTADGHSAHVSGGNALFSLLGFAGMYALLSVLFFFVAVRIISQGPVGEGSVDDGPQAGPHHVPNHGSGAMS